MAFTKKTAARTSSALLQIFVSSEMLSSDPTQQVFFFFTFLDAFFFSLKRLYCISTFGLKACSMSTLRIKTKCPLRETEGLRKQPEATGVRGY